MFFTMYITQLYLFLQLAMCKFIIKENWFRCSEKMQFPNVLDPLAKLIVNLGGVSGSLGSENSINSFILVSTILSPLICYESVYGEVKLGVTNLLAIITNDGWWKNTAGYKRTFNMLD